MYKWTKHYFELKKIYSKLWLKNPHFKSFSHKKDNALIAAPTPNRHSIILNQQTLSSSPKTKKIITFVSLSVNTKLGSKLELINLYFCARNHVYRGYGYGVTAKKPSI